MAAPSNAGLEKGMVSLECDDSVGVDSLCSVPGLYDFALFAGVDSFDTDRLILELDFDFVDKLSEVVGLAFEFDLELVYTWSVVDGLAFEFVDRWSLMVGLAFELDLELADTWRMVFGYFVANGCEGDFC